MIWIVLVIVAVVVVWYIAAMNSLRQKEIKLMKPCPALMLL